MTPKMIGSRTVIKGLMGTADVAPLTAASSTRTPRATPGCAGTPPTSLWAISSEQVAGPARSAGRSCCTGPSGSNS
jgi:hypothetical protein